ncbi:DDE superfamily endonuclease [Mycena sanguinolenta]|uniref:DDE superfamily endonuclease n=1 Tax=Mycena sanguinolenta TaxID=230812 RepID=A0A8H6U3U9_9AGAR|nr:DDE superfamily endonuclease [Mycena sanguinolenta]
MAEDEDSDERSDQNTATPSSIAAHSPSPVPFRRIARSAKFTFTPPTPSKSGAPSPSSSPSTRKTSSKRPKGHPDAPTPNPSPEKRRIFKRRSNNSLAPPPQPLFAAAASFAHQTAEVDINSRMTLRGETDGEGGGDEDCDDDLFWGPEDDVPGPPESQISPNISPINATAQPNDEASYHDLPPLQYPSDSEASDSDDDESRAPRPAAPKSALHPQPRKPAVIGKITSFWKVETAEEKTVRLEKDGRKYAERAEQVQLREVEEKRKKMARERVDANERMQRYRKRKREERIAEGWVPGQKRKRVELLEYDNTTGPDPRFAEFSRPRRDFKEDAQKKNKPSGRKRKIRNAMPRTSIGKAPCCGRRSRKQLDGLFPHGALRLTEQVIGRWIEEVAGISRWKESIRQKVELGRGNSPGGHTTRCGVLHPYPETCKKINDHLTSLRAAGVTLTLLTIRGIMVSHIEHDAPEVFERTMGDGSHFRCSESFVRRYLRNTLGWSGRRATKAAQKLPANHEKLLEEAFFRQAHVIRDYAVPAALIINTDQTQIVYQQGTGSTWTKRGEKQVATKSQRLVTKKKRAFTLVPSISASGKLLPMQAVFQGQTAASCPSSDAHRYEEAIELGYVMLPSKTSTYWCTQITMQFLVNTIIAPYFEAMKTELGLPPSQISIWLIDLWSVHKSQEFRDWMKKNHPTIIVLYVPGGCTGVWQPLDVGIQRLMKLSIKRSAHRDVVDEALAQIKAGKPAHEIKLDTTIGTLRNRSVGWVVQAIRDLSDPITITRAFEMCRVGDWNLSYASLTSPEALVGLRLCAVTVTGTAVTLPNRPVTVPSWEFKKPRRNGTDDGTAVTDDGPSRYRPVGKAFKASTERVGYPVPESVGTVATVTAHSPTDLPDLDDAQEEAYTHREVYDDCDVPLDIVSAHLSSDGSSVETNFAVADDGSITRSGNAEALEAEEEDEDVPTVLGRGQRKEIPARRYLGPIWEKH